MAKRERRIIRYETTGDDDFPTGIFGIQEREAGTGSIDTVSIKGYTYFRARYWTENAKGVRERKTVYARTEAGVEKKLRNLKNKPQVKRESKKLTLAQYLEERFIPGIESKVRVSTYKTYRNAVKTHIIPRIGAAKFSTLTATNADAWVTELTKDPDVGPRAAQQAFNVLRRAYAYAIELQLIDRNPLASLKAPKAKRNERHILDLEEANALLDAARESDLYALIYLAIATSMRQGELFGLHWKDVHLDKGYLRVVYTLGTGHNDEPVLGEPKTDASRRRVDLSAEAVGILKAHRETQRGKKNPHGLVFPSDGGAYIRKSNFRRRDWLPLLERSRICEKCSTSWLRGKVKACPECGSTRSKRAIPEITFHSLRHVGNSILAAQGIPLKVLQSRLGHSTSKTTFDLYTHLAPSDTATAAETMGGLLGLTSGLKSGLNGSKRATKRKAGTKKKAR